MNDYERIACIIRYLDEHHTAQPSLQRLADVVGLSESHFHRLFRRWAGVTPKDFLQCLTAEFAKRRLQQSVSVLDAALEAGLSGPARLHDLLVGLEAASPGEFKAKGAGMRIEWGFAQTPFGGCSIAWNDRGICHLAFQDATADNEPKELIQNWGAARLIRDDFNAQNRCDQVFHRDPERPAELRALVRGTPFQVKVWRALLRIPPGYLATYGWVAQRIGEPTAVRAVGQACGRNSIGVLIPCHRVIRGTGIVQGYRWGTARKQAIIAWEALPSAGTGRDTCPPSSQSPAGGRRPSVLSEAV